MRIDLVITELETGGAERCCAALAMFLQDRGHAVRIISLGPRPIELKMSVVRSLELAKIEIHFLNGLNWRSFPSVATQLRTLMRRNPPTVVQSFLWHANFATALVVPSLKIPLYGGIRVAERRRWIHRLDRWSASRSTKTICVSNGVMEWCVRVEKMDASKLVVIPNGISIAGQPSPIDGCTHRVPENARILLFVGRLDLQKGADILITRAPALLRQLPAHHLVLLGDGPLRNAANALGRLPEFSGRIHALGLRDDVRAWMARSERLILPTRFEGMPNVILEAMAEGLPIVVTRVEGVADLLGERTEEQSVDRDHWDGFFRLVVEQSNAANSKDLGQANRERALSEFELTKQLASYESYYRANEM